MLSLQTFEIVQPIHQLREIRAITNVASLLSECLFHCLVILVTSECVYALLLHFTLKYFSELTSVTTYSKTTLSWSFDICFNMFKVCCEWGYGLFFRQ